MDNNSVDKHREERKDIDCISCLIVDDEDPAHEVLMFFIAKIPWLRHVGNCYNTIDAIDMIQQLEPDIIFMDVNMPELSGLDLLSIVNLRNSHVVITTAHSKYAMDGFAHDVVSFLLKPIAFDQFLRAVTKVRRLMALERGITSVNPREKANPDAPANIAGRSLERDAAHTEPAKTEQEYMWIKSNKKMHCLWFKDIDLVEGLKDYIKVYHKEGMLVTLVPMCRMMERLPSSQFVRTHRSYIVNRSSIKIIEGNMITMTNGMQASIAVSAQRDEIFKLLTEK